MSQASRRERMAGTATGRSTVQVALALLAVVAVLLAPTFLSVSDLRLVTSIVVLAAFGVAFNFAYGFASLPSFGHAAFYGMGAYGFALTISHFEMENVFVPLLAGLVLATVVGVAIGLLALRGRGIYFALLTFALAQLIYAVVYRWPSITGGNAGTFVTVPPVFGVSLSDPAVVHVLATVVLTGFLVAIYALLRSPVGNVLKSLRQNPDRMRALGYPVRRIQITIFTISAALSGLVGVVFVVNNQFVSPDVLFWQTSIDVLIVVIIGGTLSLLGPVVGATVFVLLSEFTREFANVGLLLIGASFVGIVLLAPDGVTGRIEDLYRRLRRIGNDD